MFNLKVLTLLIIAVGAMLMLISMVKYYAVCRLTQTLLETEEAITNRWCKTYYSLMGFFLIGYLIVFFSLIYDITIVGELLTGIIFFFGAVFVFVGIALQTDMLSAIRENHERIVEQNEQLHQTEDVTIFALAYLAEIRDLETGKHLERTSQYVGVLVKNLVDSPKYSSYLTQKYICDIVKSAPLHDIGKVGIPDSILKKNGKLTAEEFEVIKQHCEYGANILKTAEQKLGFESFLRIAIQLVMSHHERWDGLGYPHGLKGDEIPLSARIMALADVYDALRSERCYKKSFSHEESCMIITREKGKQFDPDIVDAFLKTEKVFLEISNTIVD
ncbi:MAG TPA: hypothetical protein DEP36_17190 [Gammaproteobacteria bacterium]|nr:hypothetical protein [Gammaproteobacteria bacterium]